MSIQRLIDKMKEARAVKSREESLDSAREASCLAIISFGRAEKLAFARAAATDEERAHLGSCEWCAFRIGAYEQNSHPTRLQLLKGVLDLVTDDDQQVLNTHLDECTYCRQWISTPPMVAIQAAVSTGRRSIEWAARTLSLFPEERRQLPALQVLYAGRRESTDGFRAFCERGPVNLRLTQYGTRLSIGVAAKASAVSFQEVMVEIAGAGKVRSVRVPLVVQEGVLVGGAEIENFHELLTSNGELCFTAVPIEDMFGENEAK